MPKGLRKPVTRWTSGYPRWRHPPFLGENTQGQAGGGHWIRSSRGKDLIFFRFESEDRVSRETFAQSLEDVHEFKEINRKFQDGFLSPREGPCWVMGEPEFTQIDRKFQDGFLGPREEPCRIMGGPDYFDRRGRRGGGKSTH